jgi:hypothetical protein
MAAADCRMLISDTFCHPMRHVLSPRQLLTRDRPTTLSPFAAEKTGFSLHAHPESFLILLWPAACHYVWRATGNGEKLRSLTQLNVGECLGGGAKAREAPNAGSVPFVFSATLLTINMTKTGSRFLTNPPDCGTGRGIAMISKVCRRHEKRGLAVETAHTKVISQFGG